MKKAVIPALFLAAFACAAGFVAWAMAGHGTIGLLRVTPVFLYVLVVIGVLLLALTGLFAWWAFLYRRSKFAAARRLAIVVAAASAVCLVVYPAGFWQLGAFGHAGDIAPLPQLSLVPRAQQPLHFAVGGDTQIGSGTNNAAQTQAMLDLISSPTIGYDAFFFLGDMVEYGFRDSNWREALDTFAPTASKIPMFTVAGNHDTMFGGLSRYLDYCRPAAAGSPDDSRLWYRVDAGKVHFLVLDVEWSAETFTKEQSDWLETQLASIPDGDWKIVLSHGFYYSSGSTSMGWNWYDNPETISALTPIFEKYGVDLVFSGHNHCLECLQKNGVTYVVAGGFGGKLDPAPTYVSPSSVWLDPEQFGFADVIIDGDEATLSFIDPGEQVLYSITVARQ